MLTDLTHVTVLVDDADEALSWYTEKLGFEKRADESFAPGMRWLTVAPPDSDGTEVVLQEPTEEGFGDAAAELRGRIGKGTTWVFAVEDCRATCEELKERGVAVTSEPEETPWGVSAVIEDLYGNPFNLVEEHDE